MLDVGELRYSVKATEVVIHKRLDRGQWTEDYGTDCLLPALQKFEQFGLEHLAEFDSIDTLCHEWFLRAKVHKDNTNNYVVVGRLFLTVFDALEAVETLDPEGEKESE